jgi:hypothetical protein
MSFTLSYFNVPPDRADRSVGAATQGVSP